MYRVMQTNICLTHTGVVYSIHLPELNPVYVVHTLYVHITVVYTLLFECNVYV